MREGDGRMPEDEEYEISWLALKPGTPVVSSDGNELGHVTHVLGDVSKDIFDGIGYRSHLMGQQEMLPQSVIARITTKRVELSLGEAQAKAESQRYKEEQEFRVDPGMKRPHWMRDEDD